MTRIQRNVVANAISYACAAGMAIVCVPAYIRFMGMEAFGLVGFFIALYTVSAPLGMGLSMAFNRELARLSVRDNALSEMRDLLRTLESVYWLVAVAVGFGAVAAAPLISQHWIKAEVLPVTTVMRAIWLMGVALTLQFPYALYAGGLNGLQRQTLLSVINICMNSLRFGGALLALWVVSPTIEVFFIWNASVGALHSIVLGVAIRRCLSGSPGRPAFRWGLLKKIGRFAAGTSGISLAALVLTQLDKGILSRMLSLEMFGYYSLATMASFSLYMLIGPVFTALSPRFAQLAGLGDREGLKALYHLGCQVISVLVITAAAVGVVFAGELLSVWTGDPVTVERAHLVMSLLFIGTSLNCLANLPYALQLAYGWTSLAFYTNLVAIAVLAPLIVLLSVCYGAEGAAMAWVMLNLGVVLISVQIAHARLLPGEIRRWFLDDIGRPLAAAVPVVLVARLLISPEMTRPGLFLCLAALAFVTLVCSALAAPDLRQSMVKWVLERGRR